jgi:hypothetical protein
MSEECSHLNDVKKELLQRYETLFDGTLGDFQTKLVHLELKKEEKKLQYIPDHILYLTYTKQH